MISTQLTLAKNKMSIPCDHLWLAFCVCDRWVGLKEGECLLAAGEYRGKLVWRSPCRIRRRQKINGGRAAGGLVVGLCGTSWSSPRGPATSRT